MKSVAMRIGAGVGAVLFLGLMIFLSEWSFQRVLDFRALERIPLSRIAESVGGETQVRGLALQYDKLLKAPKTNTPSLYYRYLLEKEEIDSDGDTRWRTVRDETEVTDFFLEDETGKALVRAQQDEWRVTFSVKQKYYTKSGSYRHTEWRIDPNDTITVFGWMSYEPEPLIRFSVDGQYLPIISSFTADEERAEIAWIAIFMLWGGITALIVACLLVLYTLRIHRTLVFLTIISLAGTLLLVHYGYRSVGRDLNDGMSRVTQQRERAETLSKKLFGEHNIPFDGFDQPFDLKTDKFATLSAEDKSRVNAWRRTTYEVRERYLQQIARFPESFFARSRGQDSPPTVSLPSDELQLAKGNLDVYRSTRIGQYTLVVPLILVVTAGIAWFSFRTIKTKRTQENIPTSKTAGVVFGLTELKGTLIPTDKDKMLVTPLTDVYCTWYHYIVEEQIGSGKNKSWRTIKDEIKKQPFYCEDDEGRIRIFPGQADCITKHRKVERSGDMRYTEYSLQPDDALYVLGKARQDKTTGDTLVIGHEKGSPFIIANLTEEEVMLRKAMSGMSMMGGAVSILFLSALMVAGANGQFSSLDFLTASLIAPFFMVTVVFVLMYNDLVFLKQRCERNWANIQVSLKKRANLIPQLEKVVKQYLAHERSLQEELAKLREAGRRAESPRDFDDYMSLEHDSIDQVSARVEKYPDLEGIDLISLFNRRLIKLENEVALIRAGFNDSVTHYVTRLQSFPDNVLAKLFKFEPLSVLSYTEEAHKVPVVKIREYS